MERAARAAVSHPVVHPLLPPHALTGELIVVQPSFFASISGQCSNCQANAQPNTVSLESWSPTQSITVAVSAWPSVTATGTISGLQPYVNYDFRVVDNTNEV